MRHKLFVYGTLKREHPNSDLLADSKFIAPAYVRGMTMLNTDAFPYAYQTQPKDFIIGELYEINEATFKLCDQLEGYPSHYNRKKVTAYSLDHIFAQYPDKYGAWIYFSEHVTKQDIAEYGTTRDWGRKMNWGRIPLKTKEDK